MHYKLTVSTPSCSYQFRSLPKSCSFDVQSLGLLYLDGPGRVRATQPNCGSHPRLIRTKTWLGWNLMKHFKNYLHKMSPNRREYIKWAGGEFPRMKSTRREKLKCLGKKICLGWHRDHQSQVIMPGSGLLGPRRVTQIISYFLELCLKY